MVGVSTGGSLGLLSTLGMWENGGVEGSILAGDAVQGRMEESSGRTLEGCICVAGRAGAGSLREVFHLGCEHTENSHQMVC